MRSVTLDTTSIASRPSVLWGTIGWPTLSAGTQSERSPFADLMFKLG